MFRKKQGAIGEPDDVVDDAGLGEEPRTAEYHTEGSASMAPDSHEDTADDPEGDEYDDYVPRRRDPIAGWMVLVSVLLVLVVVVATASIVFFLLGMRGAPRTEVERAITAAEASAHENQTAESYIDLGYAYLSGGRYSEARSAASRSRKIKDTSKADLLEADIARMQGDHAKAVSLYQKAAKRDEAEVKKEVAALQKRGIFAPYSRANRVQIMIGQGESLRELGRKKEALKAFQAAVKHDTTNSFALVRIGDLSAAIGQEKEARAAYKEALRFIPDYKPALDGLASLDDGTKE